jgi:DNA-binding beta-propeller fold protein YncE
MTVAWSNTAGRGPSHGRAATCRTIESMRKLVIVVAVGLAALAGCSPGPDRPSDAPVSAAPAGTPTSASAPSAGQPSTARRAAVAWVAAEDGRSVSRIDLERRTAALTVAVPGRPHNLTALPGGGAVATLPGEGRIVLVDARGRPTPVPLGGSPHDVKVARDTLVIANTAAARLDLVGTKGERRGRIALRGRPHDLAVTADGRRAWVSLEGSDQIAVVDLRARAVSRYLSTGRRPHDLLLGRDGRAWVTDWDGSLEVYAPSGRRLGEVALGEEAHHLAFTPDGAQVWLSDSPGRLVFVVDTRSLRLVTRLPLEGAPHHLAVVGRWAAVADNTNGTVVLFDAASRRPVGRVRVGDGPHGLAASAG